MNYPTQNGSSNDSDSGALSPAEATLRLLANLPAPEGLEDRVHAGLLAAPRRGRVLAWPGAFTPAGGWLRSAAAAAIVCVVAGGGWGIYSHVQPSQPGRAIAVPHVGTPGGFSEGEAMRRPQTLDRPVVAHPAAARLPQAKVPAKAPAKPAATPMHGGQSAAMSKTGAPAAAPQVQ